MTPSVDDAELLAFLQDVFPMPAEEHADDGFTSDASLCREFSSIVTSTSQSISPKQRAVIQKTTTVKRPVERKVQKHNQHQYFMKSSLSKMNGRTVANGNMRRKRVPIEKQRLYDRRAAEKKKKTNYKIATVTQSTIEEVIVEYVFYSVAYAELLKHALASHAHDTKTAKRMSIFDRIQCCEDALRKVKMAQGAAKMFKFADDQRTLESDLEELLTILAGECKKEPILTELSF